MSKKAEYNIGDVFGKRTIIDHAESYPKSGKARVKVKCECGKEDIVSLQNLLHGKADMCKSCSTKLTQSGLGKFGITKELWYEMWQGMKARCYNPNNKEYHNYGARGIKVCKEWHDSAIFGEWAMSHGYEKGLQIDRIDVDGDYCPENCRWVTPQVNANNRRNNVLVTIEGITDTVANTCRRYGLRSSLVAKYKRRKNVSYEDAILFRIHQLSGGKIK